MIWIAIAILAGSVALDQITKAIVVSRMELYEEVPFLPGFIRFYRTEDTGAAFSLLKDNPWILMIFTLIGVSSSRLKALAMRYILSPPKIRARSSSIEI